MTSSGKGGHEEATVKQLAELHDQHEQSVAQVQRIANQLTAALGRPIALALIIGVLVAWIAGNYAAHVLGTRAIEQFPFPDLQLVVTIAALLVALLILTTQRHEEELADKRARLTLQIAVLSEKKIAKLIELLEEQRRDNPLLPSRVDQEATAMASASDPRSSLERLESFERQGG